MEWGRRLASTLLSNQDNVIHGLLLSSFAVLSARSMSEQAELDSLEAERESLSSSNRALRKTMWEWRQSLDGSGEGERIGKIFGDEKKVVSFSSLPMPGGMEGEGSDASNVAQRPTPKTPFAV